MVARVFTLYQSIRSLTQLILTLASPSPSPVAVTLPLPQPKPEPQPKAERAEHPCGDDAALSEAGGAKHTVGRAGAARRVDRPLVRRVRLRNVDELHARAAGELAREGRECGRQPP